LKVLIINSDHFLTKKKPISGIFQWHQAQYLQSNNYQISIISVGFLLFRELFKKYEYTKFEKINNINIYRNYKKTYLPLRYIPFNLMIFFYYRSAKKIFDKYLKYNDFPDLIHAHNIEFAGLIANKLSNYYNIKYIITEHSSSYCLNIIDKKKYFYYQDCITNSTLNTAVSNSLCNTLNNYFKCINKFQKLNNLLDPDLVIDTLNSKIKQKSKKFIYLSVGRLDRNKNHFNLIKSFNLTFANNPNTLLIIGGDGEERINLMNYISEYNLEKKIILLGYVDRIRLKKLFKIADCFVLPSTYETFGVVLIEALSYGVPLIAKAGSGPDEIIDDTNGILYKSDTLECISSSLKYIFINKSKFNNEKIKNETIFKYKGNQLLNILTENILNS
jgi:glycosyltransferase involved in cell wall biosynthesis